MAKMEDAMAVERHLGVRGHNESGRRRFDHGGPGNDVARRELFHLEDLGVMPFAEPHAPLTAVDVLLAEQEAVVPPFPG